MSDDKMDMKLNFDVHVTDLEKAEILRREIGQMAADLARLGRNANASLKGLAGLGKIRLRGAGQEDTKVARDALDLDRARMTELNRQFRFKGRMASQQRREEAAEAKAIAEQQDARERNFRAQLALNTKLARQREREESAAEKAIRDQVLETSRLRDKEARKAREEAKRAERDRAKAARYAQAGAGQVRSGVGRIAGIGAGMAAGLGYGGTRMIERGVSTRMDIDSAETSLKIFGDQGGGKKFTSADIKRLRRGPKGLDAEAIRNGVSVKAAIEAFTEVNKAGLIDPLEQTRTLLAGTTALELDPRATTKLMGTMARNMGAAATPARLKQALNALAVGAREDPTQANEIVEGMNRAQGVLAMTKGITEEDLVALVSGGQSVGIQPGKAGTFLPSLARDILKGNDKFLDKGKRKELNYAAKHLGFGSAKNMATQFAGEKGKEVLYQIFGRLKAMDPAMRAQVANALSGGQWSDEDLQVVNGLDGMISTYKAIHDPKNAEFIDQARNKKMKSWAGMWFQSQAIFSLFWESFGVGFDGILREINSFFLDLNGRFNYDQVSQYVRDALDGLKDGLGLDTWKQGLEAIFPSDISGLGQGIKDFARGFGAGLRSMGETLRSVGSMFGMGGGAETIGNVAAKFFTLSAACIALAPVIGVIGGLGSIVLGIVGMARAAMTVVGGGAAAAGGLGGGAVAGALAGVARILSGGFVLSLAAAIGSMRGEIVTLMIDAVKPMISALWEGLKSALSLDGIKSAGKAILGEIVPAPLQRWLDGDKPVPGQGADQGTRWVDPPARTGTSEAPAEKSATEKLTDATREQTAILKENLEVDKKTLEAAQVSKDAKAAATAPTPNADGAITYEQWKQQFAGLHGAQLGRALEAQKARTGGTPLPDTGMRRNGVIGGDTASPDQKSGGSRSWRNNNPGNIEAGAFATANGAIGTDGRFARFPSYEAGRKAQEKLLFESKGYRDLTLGQAIRRWAPGSENNVPAYIAAMGGDSSKRMSEYTTDQRGRLLDAMQRHEGWRPGTVTGGGSGGNVAASMPGGNPVDVASRYLGMGENNNRAAVEGFVGHDIRGAAQAWCSRFVNASLAAVGQTGSGSAVANSFLHWGRAITADMVQKGDVLVDHRGRGDNGLGGHVGMSTGRSRMGRNGELELEMIAGNSNDQVQTTWERASKLAIRRSTQVAEQAKALVEPKLPAGVGGDGSVGGGLGGAAPGCGLGADAPLSNRSGSGGGTSYGRIGHNVNNQIHINGHNKSPEELAGTVQRHLQDSMNRRTHDFDGFA